MRKLDGVFQRRIYADKEHETRTNLDNDIYYDALEKNTENDSLLKFSEIALYLKMNPYILTGYRGQLNTRKCLQSVFWWTNETLNIWTHVFGLMLMIGLTLRDVYVVWDISPTRHLSISLLTTFVFQVSLILSIVYHVFLCRSEEDQRFFLALDMFGVSLSLLSAYLITIYFGFVCLKTWRNVYMGMGMILFVMSVLLSREDFSPARKLICFTCWLVFAVIATVHWYISLGGFQNTLVQETIPVLVLLYSVGTVGVLIYMLKIPECFLPGRCDYIGSSHQWWHLLLVAVLYICHVNARKFLKVILNYRCPYSF